MPYRRKDSSKIWIRVGGKCMSADTEVWADAERLENKLNSDRWVEEKVGIKPPRPFKELDQQWRKEKDHKVSFEDDVRIIEWWGDSKRLGKITDIRQITREKVDEIVQRDRPVTPAIATSENNTANHYVNILSAMLNAAARDWGWTDNSPRLRRYPVFDGREAWFTLEQWQKLQPQLPEHLERAARFALGTGLRKEKVFSLEWSQLDLKRRTLTFNGTSNKLGNTIPLNDAAMSVIEDIQKSTVRHMVRVFTWNKPKLVGDELSHTVEPLNDYGRAWYKAMGRAGLGTYEDGKWAGEHDWHSFRHTFASWLTQAGVPAEFIDRLGGWAGGAKRGNTRERYAHLNVEHLRPYAKVIDRVLAGEQVQLIVRSA